MRDLRAAFIYAIGISLLSLAVPLTVQMLISQALAGVLWQPAIILTLILVLTLGFRSFLEACEALLIEAVSRRIFVRVARDFTSRIVRLGRVRPHDLPARLAAHRIFDGAVLEKSLGAIVYDGFSGILTILATVTLLTIYHPIFALAAFIVIALACVIAWVPSRRASTHARYESKAKHNIAVELDRIGHRPDLFAGRPAADFALGEIEYLLGKWSSARQTHFRVYFKQFIGLIIVQVIASTALLALGAWLIFIGELTVGQLVAGELMMTAALAGVARFGKLLPKVYDMLAAIDKVGQVLDLPKRSEGGLELPQAPVEVTLPAASGARGVGVPAGARVWLRGRPDSLERLFRGLNDGHDDIRIDGRAASGYAPATLGERVIWADEPYNLPGPLLANLRMVDPTMSEEEAWDLLTVTGFDLSRHKDGIHKEIGPDGQGLTRAERVRLSVARAIASRPAILILDGILDRLEAGERQTLLRLVAGSVETCPWTLLVTSADPTVARVLDMVIDARDQGFVPVDDSGVVR
jgi:ABC-type bacteriocin/lantibiotic exporter with double-glycine peptidase domain